MCGHQRTKLSLKERGAQCCTGPPVLMRTSFTLALWYLLLRSLHSDHRFRSGRWELGPGDAIQDPICLLNLQSFNDPVSRLLVKGSTIPSLDACSSLKERTFRNTVQLVVSKALVGGRFCFSLNDGNLDLVRPECIRILWAPHDSNRRLAVWTDTTATTSVSTATRLTFVTSVENDSIDIAIVRRTLLEVSRPKGFRLSKVSRPTEASPRSLGLESIALHAGDNTFDQPRTFYGLWIDNILGKGCLGQGGGV
jgi:hypothetical protein